MHNPESEDRVIQDLWEALEHAPREAGDAAAPGSAGEPDSSDGESETFRRLYVETLGLLACENSPLEPPPEHKARVMAAIAGRPEADSGEAAEPAKFFDRRDRGQVDPPVAPLAGPKQGTRRSWWLSLAAALGLALLGLSGWLYNQVGQQRIEIAELSERFETLRSRSGDLALSQGEVVRILRGMEILPEASVEVCRLRPVGSHPAQPEAMGTLVVVKDDGPWSVRLHHLDPAPLGHTYLLWFLQDGVPTEKRILTLGPDHSAQLVAHQAPQLMNAAAVTLEASVDVEDPTGPYILYGAAGDMELL